MSLNNIEILGFNSLVNLSQINADEVNTDILTKYNPDISDAQFDTLVGISTAQTIQQQINGVTGNISTLQGQVTTLQGQMTTANSNISTLQSQYTTLNGEVNTLQSEMNTAQSDINTLQSEMNTAQSDINDAQADIGALYGITSTTAAAVAGLSVSQAAQDVTLAAHTASIGGLNGDVNGLDNRVDALEVKTDDQSWTTLGGTRFSRQVHVSNTGVGGTDAVYLDSNGESEFLYGLTAQARIISTAGTSQVSSLLVNTTAEVTNDLTITNGDLFVTRNTLTNDKKIVLYDNTTGNDYDYLGFWTDSGSIGKKFLNAEIDGVAGSAFQWYYGNNAGSARILAKSLSSTDETSYTPISTFLKANGFSQQIQFNRNTGTNLVRIDMLGDSFGAASFDGQIIQTGVGGGANDNRGTMTIQSGNLNLNALTPATGKITLTSTGETEINCVTLDMNASGAVTIDGATTTNITSTDDLTIQTTNPFGDILVSSAGASTFTSVGQTQINSGVLDINASGAVTLDSTSTIGITGTTNTILGITNINRTGSAATSIGNTGALILNGSTYALTTTGNQTVTSSAGDVTISATDVRINSTGTNTGEFIVRANTNVDIKTTTGNIVSDANTTHDLISGGVMTLTAGDGLVCSTTNLLADMTFTAQNSLLFKATDGFWTAQSSSNYYYQAGTNDYFVSYGNQTGAEFLNTTFTSGGTPQAAIESVTHRVVVSSDIETYIGKGSAPTTIRGSAISTQGPTTIDVNNTFNMVPTGTIIMNVSATGLSGFVLCNGQAVSRTVVYNRLFAVIGTTFGAGNGTTTFNVPNFQGAFLRGAGNQTVGGVTYAGAAVGTAQQDSVLEAYNEGYWNVDAGGGGSNRSVRSRLQITADPEDTGGNSTTKFLRQNATENRVFNYSINYYIRY